MAKPLYFRIDWTDLKAAMLHLISGDSSDFNLSSNKRLALEYVQGGTWDGFSKGQLERWLREGFQTEAIHGLEDFIPPIREKRKLRFSEEGDEFHFDIAAGGDDNYMSEWTKRDEIPGLAIDVEIGFSASVNSAVLNAYYTWLCKVAFSIEAAGIDTEITLRYEMNNFGCIGGRAPATTVIRVKKENEATDFLSWSVMLSPASFRSAMFIANTLHSESRKMEVATHQGSRNSGRWAIEFLSDTRTLKVTCPWQAESFPEAEMTHQLREALKQGTNAARK